MHDALSSIYATLILNYCSDINIIDDLIFASILGYLGLKFDQVNEHLYKLTTENIRGIKQVWENPVLHSQQAKLPNVPSSKHITWIVIHLHLELQKLSHEINSIFEIQMTWKMVCYLGFIAEFYRELYTAIFVRNYVPNKRILIVIIIILWLTWYISRVILINYMCEKVSAKANTTGEVLSKILYFSYDEEIRENILQLLLQVTQAPLRFCGLRSFQFGYKFLYGMKLTDLWIAGHRTSDINRNLRIKSAKTIYISVIQRLSVVFDTQKRLSEKSRTRCFFDIGLKEESQKLGRIVFELYDSVVPRTCENFAAFCRGVNGLSYKHTPFHRIVSGYWCQGGDVTKFDGTGGTSIYGDSFDKENSNLRHIGPGILSTCDNNDGKNDSKFNLTFKCLKTVDPHKTVFGRVIDGMMNIYKIEGFGTKTGKPIKSVIVLNCGVLSAKRTYERLSKFQI
ncbi:uncharacterized protein [Temnothorax nylanderi]|uniref:uncharacterized protein n=1 Tax=Temnothorax nylanderi TaxID=102681 RepID=UPI003A895357